MKWKMPCKLLSILVATGICIVFAKPSLSAEKADKNSDEFFGLDKLWTIELKVSAEEWKKINPQGGGGFPGHPPFMGDRRSAGDGIRQASQQPGQRQGMERRPGGPGGFGPGGPGGPGGGPGGPGGGPGGRPGGPFQGIEYPYVAGDFIIDGATVAKVGIRYKGKASFFMSGNSPKKSFKISFNHFDKNQKLFGLSKINLNNNTADPSQMVDALSYETFREFNLPAPRTAFAKVYLTIDGEKNREYIGLYTIAEQIDSTFLKRNFSDSKGLLLKPQMVQGFPYYGRNWEDYEKSYGSKSSEVSWSEAKRFMDFAQLVNEATDTEFRQKVGDYTDIDQFLRFLAVNVGISNYDSILGMGQNYYIYYEPEKKKFVWIPWDLNLAFGKFMMINSPVEQMEANIKEPNASRQPLIERILAIPEYKEKYQNYLREFIGKDFQPSRIRKNIDAVNAAISEAVKEDPGYSEKDYAKSISSDPMDKNQKSSFPFPPQGAMNQGGKRDGQGNNPGGGRGGFGPGGRGPGGPGGPGGFGPRPESGFSLESWVKGRVESIQKQLNGESEGIKLAMRGPGGHGPGGPGGPGGGGPGGPGGFGPGGPGGFGPGMFLGPQLFPAIDKNNDQKIAKSESNDSWNQLATAWDKDGNKSLSQKEITDGLSQIFKIPEDMPFAPPGGFSPGMMILPSILEKADKNGEISLSSFVTLWDEWFIQWDADKNGVLDNNEYANGLTGIVGPPPGMMDGPPGMDNPPGF